MGSHRVRHDDSNLAAAAGMQQTGNRPPKGDHDLCVCVCGASVALVSALELLGPTTELVVIYNLFIVYHNPIEKWFVVVVKNKKRWYFKMTTFLDCGLLMMHPFTELFHYCNLLQMPDDHRKVDAEFLGNISCSWKRISFDDPLCWSLSTCNG